jgi:hypothetical protein
MSEQQQSKVEHLLATLVIMLTVLGFTSWVFNQRHVEVNEMSVDVVGTAVTSAPASH